MNEELIKKISIELKIKENQTVKTLELLKDNNTIPFIARYRKEVTEGLDEEQIRKISEEYEYLQNLEKRKEAVINLINEKGMLTEELKKDILACTKLVEIEDIYRPFKEKKKTKATEAIKNGLEPLAKYILTFPEKLENIDKYINENVKTVEDAITGAKYIIAETISDNADYRKFIRRNVFLNGKIVTSKKTKAIDENKTYEMYYSYLEKVNEIKHHRLLAINRAENEGIISVKIDNDNTKIFEYLEKNIIIKSNTAVTEILKETIQDSFKRLIFPSIEREIRSYLNELAEDAAIKVFSNNLENLLLQPPMKDKVVLGLDPAFRTGCKLAVLNATGKYECISVIYPHEPKNEKEKSKKIVLDLIGKYNIDIIAIGNGTASRESEAFIVDCIKDSKKDVKYIIVNEAGASVYSASKLAIEEFPDLHVEQRSAISIARRLQDPLSELVKIDSKSIGVGQYQHDVTEKKLNESLDFVVLKAVNSVGVNINTASTSLLKYVSGMNKKTIESILNYRDINGKILTRKELSKIKGYTKKAYEQSIGFLRILDGENYLDRTAIHTESYDIAKKILKILKLEEKDIGTESICEKLDNLNIDELIEILNTDKYTLDDIIKSLKNPLRDPRDEIDVPILKSDILKLEDLKVGMKLQGTVRNVVDFGAFIDIGLKNDGLAHISKLTNKYIKHPSDVLNVGDIVDCYVLDIMSDKKKVSLSLIEV